NRVCVAHRPTIRPAPTAARRAATTSRPHCIAATNKVRFRRYKAGTKRAGLFSLLMGFADALHLHRGQLCRIVEELIDQRALIVDHTSLFEGGDAHKQEGSEQDGNQPMT